MNRANQEACGNLPLGERVRFRLRLRLQNFCWGCSSGNLSSLPLVVRFKYAAHVPTARFFWFLNGQFINYARTHQELRLHQGLQVEDQPTACIGGAERQRENDNLAGALTDLSDR